MPARTSPRTAALIERHAAFANAVRISVDEADDASEPDTADLFTEVSRGLDKQPWFLEAHVQQDTGPTRDGNGTSGR